MRLKCAIKIKKLLNYFMFTMLTVMGGKWLGLGLPLLNINIYMIFLLLLLLLLFLLSFARLFVCCLVVALIGAQLVTLLIFANSYNFHLLLQFFLFLFAAKTICNCYMMSFCKCCELQKSKKKTKTKKKPKT